MCGARSLHANEIAKVSVFVFIYCCIPFWWWLFLIWYNGNSSSSNRLDRRHSFWLLSSIINHCVNIYLIFVAISSFYLCCGCFCFCFTLCLITVRYMRKLRKREREIECLMVVVAECIFNLVAPHTHTLARTPQQTC